MNDMNQKPQLSYRAQLAILLALIGVFMVIGSFLMIMLASTKLDIAFELVPGALNNPANASLIRWLNTLATFMIFFIPAFIYARIMNRNPVAYLGFNSVMSRKQIVIVLVLTIAAMATSGALAELNQHIPLPVKWMIKARAMEEAYKTTMLSMAVMKNFNEYLVVLLVMALTPAMFEEVLFRGAFQQLFIGWTKRAWAGILITSIIFSAIHFSYFGFLPRIVLGIVLGGIFYYSKNIWLNILLHFLNNAIVVTQLYIVGKQGGSIEKAMDENAPVWTGIFAIAGLLLLFRLFRKETEKVLAAKRVVLINEKDG